MKPENKVLDEVVVVGYGTQKKSTLTGSVATVKGGEIAQTPVANVSSSLAGRAAGVSMRPNGGQPGSDTPDIHIRGIGTTGNNQPLIVVDGIIRNNIKPNRPGFDRDHFDFERCGGGSPPMDWAGLMAWCLSLPSAEKPARRR